MKSPLKSWTNLLSSIANVKDFISSTYSFIVIYINLFFIFLFILFFAFCVYKLFKHIKNKRFILLCSSTAVCGEDFFNFSSSLNFISILPADKKSFAREYVSIIWMRWKKKKYSLVCNNAALTDKKCFSRKSCACLCVALNRTGGIYWYCPWRSKENSFKNFPRIFCASGYTVMPIRRGITRLPAHNKLTFFFVIFLTNKK